MRVIVTGAAGFIGGHLKRRLMQVGHHVVSTDLPARLDAENTNQTFTWDIREPCETVSIGSMDVAVHLAAIASPNVCTQDPKLAWETNVMGTFNVLTWLKGLGVRRVVFMSSAHVYGISPKYLPTDETHPLSLLDVYTTTKVMGEELCEMFWKNHGLSYCALRLFNGYGQNQSSAYFLGKKLAQAREGKLTIKGGAVTKDWVAVEDICDAIVRALESDFVGAVNVGTGVETSLHQIVKTISFNGEGTPTHPKAIPIYDEGPADSGPTRMCCDWGRAKRVLGWEPKVKFEDGLRELIEASR